MHEKKYYHWIGRVWSYKEIQPRIIAETLMIEESGDALKDYKVLTLGEPRMVQVDYDQFRNHRRNLYDLKWKYTPAEILYPTDSNVNKK